MYPRSRLVTQHIREYSQVSPGPILDFHAGFLWSHVSTVYCLLYYSWPYFSPLPLPTQILSNRTVNSFLLSTQVFGASSNIFSGILQYPIKLYFTPLMVSHIAIIMYVCSKTQIRSCSRIVTITSHTYIPILIMFKDKLTCTLNWHWIQCTKDEKNSKMTNEKSILDVKLHIGLQSYWVGRPDNKSIIYVCFWASVTI